MEWIIVTVIVIFAALLACILFARQLSKHTFRCKSCSKEFKVSWNKLIFAVHSYDQYQIRCPYCNNKGCIEEPLE